MKKVAIFDVDGTLLDTTEGVLSSVRYTIEMHKLDMPSEEELKKFIGPPIQDSFQRIYGFEKEKLQELATTFRNHYKDVDLLKAVPYEGILETCRKLQESGVKIAVATYKRQDYAEKIVRHFGFGAYTDVIYGADHENKLKKADIIKLCLESTGVCDKKTAVMIGDSDNDAIGAQRLDLDFLGVTYGFGFKNKEEILRFPNAVGTACRAEELLDFFDNKGDCLK